MKVLQLTVHFAPNIGGVETHLSDLVDELIKLKNEVFVLTYLPLTAKAKAKVWEFGPNLKILRLPWITGFFYKLIKNPALEFLYLSPLLFLVTPFVLVLFRPNVIHTHGLIAGFVGVFWGRVFGIRTISTTHSIYHFPESGSYRNLSTWIFKNSSHVLTLSKQSKTEIEQLGIKEYKITVFTYWVDLDKFRKVNRAKSKLHWENKFVVLFVGRLIEEKGVLVLLESLKSWNKSINLAIVGTGPLEERIKNHELRIRNLEYLGRVDNRKLSMYYSASDLTIVPSVHDEGFGRVILESLACGTPVVAANRGAIPEAMTNKVGSLIKITPETIEKEVEYYFTHKGELNTKSKFAVVFASERYSSDNVKTILQSYE